MTLSGKETKLEQILMIISGHVMTLTELKCTESIGNGLDLTNL